MKRIHVSADREYEVCVDVDFKAELVKLTKERTRVAIVFSESMKDRIPTFDSGDTEFFYLPIADGEAGKSATILSQAWNWLGAAGFTRTDLIVGIGGGAVTDFAGYLAASWLRGVDWVAIPTTVAGMVDAAVGGKTGINSDYGKNLIGAFHSPVSVLIDPIWLDTLSDRDFAAGLAEVVKCGFIRDQKILDLIKSKSLADIRSSREVTLELIERSVAVKSLVVSGDFKESFDREILNYGHTYGHAVELLSKYSLRHGECVSIGMAYIAYLSEALDLISPELRALHIETLVALGLPVTYKGAEWPELLAAMKLDKKSRGNSLRFVVISEVGKTQRLENPIESALHAAYERLSQ
ncbi:AroB 3-dehydroquinate synthetase [Candidatus Nanopelagicaceae bacterium]